VKIKKIHKVGWPLLTYFMKLAELVTLVEHSKMYKVLKNSTDAISRAAFLQKNKNFVKIFFKNNYE